MGVILKDKMEDFPAAEGEFQSLLTRYPDNIYRLDTYYNLYLMFMRAGDTVKAERYRQLILSEFPDSKYGMALRDPDYIGSLRRMAENENRYYDQALEAYLDNNNARVHEIYAKVSNDFPLSKLMPKFMFLEALTCVTDHKPEEFKQILMQMLERYPDTDLTEYASSYLKGLAEGRKLMAGAGNMRGMLWDIRLGNDSLPADTSAVKFELDPSQRQLLVFLYPTDVISPNALLFDVARHNFSSFVVKDFDLEQMNFGRLGLLIVKGFDNLNEVNHYLKVLNASQTLKLPPEVRPLVISEKNFDTLLQSGSSFDTYFNYMRDKTYTDTQERVLPSDFFEHEPPGETPEGFTPDQEQTDSETLPPDEEIPAPEPPAAPASKTPAPKAPKKPVPKPQKAPEPKKTPEAPKPAVPAPPTPQKPALPEYPEGSEGDDPLFE